MAALAWLDVAPDPVGLGVVAVVVLFVIGFVIMLAAGLVVFLWLRKRSMRHLEIALRQNSKLPDSRETQA